MGLSSGSSDESFVLFQKDSRDPLQFFGFEGFSTGGKLNGFRTIAYTRNEYDEQSIENEKLALTIPEAEKKLVEEQDNFSSVVNLVKIDEIKRLEENEAREKALK